MWRIIKEWFNRYFSEPEAVILLFTLLFGLVILMTLGGMLVPVIASIVLAYLLDWPVSGLQKLKCPRLLAVLLIFCLFLALFIFAIFWLVPLLTQQVVNLFTELPTMLGHGQRILMQLPERYPDYISAEQVQHYMGLLKTDIARHGQTILSVSLSRIPNLILIVVYLVLVPFLIFFFLKDKQRIMQWLDKSLPIRRALMVTVAQESHGQIGNYVRGKVIEIIIIGLISYGAFGFLGLQYAALLAALVGFSVLIPYVGVAVVTIPVLLIAFLQWGWDSTFIYLTITYAVIMIFDGNILAPLLLSEVVNIHPIVIIVAILIFGGLWGFWGVFFAIPLATVIKALFNAWPRSKDAIE